MCLALSTGFSTHSASPELAARPPYPHPPPSPSSDTVAPRAWKQRSLPFQQHRYEHADRGICGSELVRSLHATAFIPNLRKEGMSKHRSIGFRVMKELIDPKATEATAAAGSTLEPVRPVHTRPHDTAWCTGDRRRVRLVSRPLSRCALRKTETECWKRGPRAQKDRRRRLRDRPAYDADLGSTAVLASSVMPPCRRTDSRILGPFMRVS